MNNKNLSSESPGRSWKVPGRRRVTFQGLFQTEHPSGHQAYEYPGDLLLCRLER